jgi:hypothetical protein
MAESKKPCRRFTPAKSFAKFRGDRMDPSFAARLIMHSRDLEHREPSVKIVCPNYFERPDYGLHKWSCPNLL